MKPVIHAPYINRRTFLRRFGPAMFGTTVAANTLRDLRFMNSALAQQAPLSDYKALICVFLNGGNDSNNLIIPTTTADYANYATVRGPAIALPNTDGTGATALALTSKNGTAGYPASDGKTYGFHPAMPGLQSLFNSGKAATVFNVGNLSYPLTKAQYQSGKVPVPPQLFSHSDQQTQWQTSLPDQPYTSGWAGRMGDLMTTPNNVNANGTISMAVTVAGSNIFEVGNINAAPQYSVSTGGSVNLISIGSLGTRQTQMQSILGAEILSPDLQTNTYASVLNHSINEAGIVSTALATNASASWLSGRFPAQVTTPNGGSTFTSSLMSQMKLVARLIDLGSTPVSSGGLGMTRQVFFIQVGGYDTHTLQTGNAGQITTNNANVVVGQQANLLAELSSTMNELFLALGAMPPRGTSTNMQNQVTAFTVSDFARTFPGNGSGSDHGWGGHHVVVGGAVKGGATYGTLPVQQVNGPSDTGIGRWIPTTSVDQYSATLATWFGVSSSNLSTIFPNLGRFASSNVGFI